MLTSLIFTDPKRPNRFQPPEPLNNIARVDKICILGVTFTNHLSVSEHVRGVISSCAQTLYVMKILRAHGMCSAALHTIFRSVAVAKITYASSAWCGFSTAADRQRVEAFFRRSKRCGMSPPELPTFDELCQQSDTKLFRNILSDSSHVLHKLLPPRSVASQNYNLRKRSHN